MTRVREHYVEDELVLLNSGTVTIPITNIVPITELWLRMKATNYASVNPESPIARCVTKIEIVDGSDVLYSLTGQQAIAQAFFELGHLPYREINEWVSNTQQDTFPIRFGRFLGDEEIAFDPAMFKNPQLKVTYNLATKNAIGSGGFATGTGRLTVIARLLEKPSRRPTGFLMMKELHAWTTAASGEEPVTMPRDYPYRKLYVRSYEGGAELADAIRKLKLTCDGDQYIPLDMHSKDLVKLMENWFGAAVCAYQFTTDCDDTRELWMDHFSTVLGMVEGAGGQILNYRDPWAGRVILDHTGHGGSDEDQCSTRFQAMGVCPESVMCFPFGDQADIKDWLQAQERKDIKLKVTQGNIGGAASVFLQQYRTYGGYPV